MRYYFMPVDHGTYRHYAIVVGVHKLPDKEFKAPIVESISKVIGNVLPEGNRYSISVVMDNLDGSNALATEPPNLAINEGGILFIVLSSGSSPANEKERLEAEKELARAFTESREPISDSPEVAPFGVIVLYDCTVSVVSTVLSVRLFL